MKLTSFPVVVGTSMILVFAFSYASFEGVLSWVPVVISLAVIIVFSYFSYRIALVKKDIDELQYKSEQIYMMGYLLTLSAIAGVVLNTDGSLSNLIQAAGVKLFSSLAGLTAMMVLKDKAYLWEQELTSKEELFEFEIHKRVDNFSKIVEELRQRIAAVNEVVDVSFFEKVKILVEEYNDNLTEALSGLKKICSNVDNTTGELNKQMDQIVVSVQESSSKFDENLIDLNAAFESNSSSINKNLKESHSSINAFIEDINNSRESFKSFQDNFFGFSEGVDNERLKLLALIEKTGSAMEDLNKDQSDFIKDSKEVFELRKESASIERKLNNSLKKILGVLPKLDEITAREVEFKEERFNELAESLKNVSENLMNFNKQADVLKETTNYFSAEDFGSVTRKIEENIQATSNIFQRTKSGYEEFNENTTSILAAQKNVLEMLHSIVLELNLIKIEMQKNN